MPLNPDSRLRADVAPAVDEAEHVARKLLSGDFDGQCGTSAAIDVVRAYGDQRVAALNIPPAVLAALARGDMVAVPAQQDWRQLAEERFSEIKRAQKIIDDLSAWREAILTRQQWASAEVIQLILAESGGADEAYIAVKIASAIEAGIDAWLAAPSAARKEDGRG